MLKSVHVIINSFLFLLLDVIDFGFIFCLECNQLSVVRFRIGLEHLTLHCVPTISMDVPVIRSLSTMKAGY